MIICQECGFQNRHGTFFCEECGRNLNLGVPRVSVPPVAAVPTVTVARPTPPEAKPVSRPLQSVSPQRPSWGTSQLTHKTQLRLTFSNVPSPLTITPVDRLVLGRQDNTSPTQPDIDLVPFGALENGVSRQHAVIELKHETLTLNDLGSSNGTYLNGQRLSANQPRVLRDGDEIRFGKLVAYLHFT